MTTVLEPTGALATEPARVVGAIGAVVLSIVSLAVLLGLDADVAAGIVGVVTAGSAAVPVVLAELIRSRVYSPATVQKITRGAVLAGAGAKVERTF